MSEMPKWNLGPMMVMPEESKTTVQLPDAPCVVIWDGDHSLVVAGAHTTEPVRQYALTIGPIGRATTVAHLRALADYIERAPSIGTTKEDE